MRRHVLRAKVHSAMVTEVDLEYEGSLGMDVDLMKAARMVPFEKIDVYNLANGNRFSTYVIPLKGGSGRISVNGAAAHLARPGDRVIIASYASLEEQELDRHRPVILLVDEKNRVRRDKLAVAGLRGE